MRDSEFIRKEIISLSEDYYTESIQILLEILLDIRDILEEIRRKA